MASAPRDSPAHAALDPEDAEEFVDEVAAEVGEVSRLAVTPQARRPPQSRLQRTRRF
jgi:hypothetical protein